VNADAASDDPVDLASREAIGMCYVFDPRQRANAADVYSYLKEKLVLLLGNWIVINPTFNLCPVRQPIALFECLFKSTHFGSIGLIKKVHEDNPCEHLYSFVTVRVALVQLDYWPGLDSLQILIQ